MKKLMTIVHWLVAMFISDKTEEDENKNRTTLYSPGKMWTWLFVMVLLFTCSSVNAAKLIKKGATSQTITIVIKNSDGDPNDGSVTALDITNLNLYSQRDGAYAQIDHGALAAHAAATDAWDDLEAYHMGRGLYRIDVPDAQLDYDAGDLITYIITDTASHNQTAYYEVQLSAPVDAVLIDSNDVAADNLHAFFGNVGAADAYEQFEDMYDGTGYAGGTIELKADVTSFDGNDLVVDNIHNFFGNVGAGDPYDMFLAMYSGGVSLDDVYTDRMSEEDVATAAQTGANAALVALNLDHLLKVTTGIAADGDLGDGAGAPVVDGSVMSHLMSPTAGASDDYDASAGSTGALGAHADTLIAGVDVVSFNDQATQIEMLMDKTTGITADADLESKVVAGSVLAHILGIGADVTTFKPTTDSLEAIGTKTTDINADTDTIDTQSELRTLLTGNDMPIAASLFSTTIASVTSPTVMVMTAGPPDNDALNGCIALFQDAVNPLQRGMASIEDYAVTGGGTIFTITLANAPPYTVAATDNIILMPLPALTAVVDVTDEVGEAIANYMWDEVGSDHRTVGTFGWLVNLIQDLLY